MRPETAFQRRCRAELEDLLGRRGLSSRSEWVEGEGESYWRALVGELSARLEVFVYEDEAGYYLGSAWHIHEASDFQSEGELMEAFLADLRACLDKVPNAAG